MSDALVLGLLKGGVVVGAEIAHALFLPFDVFLLDRITIPGCGDTPLGAITTGGVRLINCAMVDDLHIPDEDIRAAVLRKSLQLAELEREYRDPGTALEIADRHIILVDDGSTSCGMLRSAIRLLRRQHAEQVIVALPVACHSAACDLRLEANDLVALSESASATPMKKCFDHFEAPSRAQLRHMIQPSEDRAALLN
jgi:putative phosphoribosyl transferase